MSENTQNKDTIKQEKKVEEPVVPTAANVIPQQAPSPNKTLLLIIVIILSLILGLLGGYIVFDVLGDKTDDSNEKQIEENEEEIEPTKEIPSPSKTPTPTTKPVETHASCIATKFDGKTYEHGDKYTTGDDCETCACSDGDWVCEVDPSCITLDSDCMYEGTKYHTGQSFPATDGCNTCSCNLGMVSCTLMLCL